MARSSVAQQIQAAFASDAFTDALASAIERRVASALTPLEARVVALEADLLGLTSHVRTVAPFASAKAGKASAKAKPGKRAKSAKSAEKPAASVADIALPAELAALAGSGYDAAKWALVRDALVAAGMKRSGDGGASKAAAAFLRGQVAFATGDAPAKGSVGLTVEQIERLADATERPAASVAPAEPKAPKPERKASFAEHMLSPEIIEPKAQARVVIARKTPNPRASVQAWLAATEDRGALPEGDDDRLSPNTVAQYRAIAKRALEILA